MMKTLILKNLNIVFLFLTVLSFLNAQSEAGAIFLVIPPSPSMNGMGEIGVGLPSDDIFAGFYNPANGLLAYQGISANTSALHIPWLRSLASELWYDYSVTGLGLIPRKYPFQLVISQQKTYLDLGEQRRTGDYGQTISSFHSYMKANALTVGIGYRHKIGAQPVFVSAGLTEKRAVQVFSELGAGELNAISKDYLTDVGLLVYTPMVSSKSKILNDELELSFTPALGYSVSNLGGYITILDPDQADPAPRLARFGLSLTTAITLNSDWTIVEWRGGRAVSDMLIDTSDPHRLPYPYQFVFGDIRIVKHIVESKADRQVEIGRGDEITIFDCFTIRRGRRIDRSGKIDLVEMGYGYQLDGLLKFLTYFTGNQGFRTFGRFIDVRYNYSKWTQYPGHPLDQTDFKSVVITFRNLDRLFSMNH
ncbi:MAG: hypothetical protein GXO90_07465 [FCB group bacterium]|nr:hypothetical protein [FCB group bacterium]